MDPTVQTMLGVGAAIFAAVYLLIRLILGVRSRPRQRREPAPPDPIAPDVAASLPALKDTRQDLQKLLYLAGIYRPSALTEYLAVRATLFLGTLVATALAALWVEPAQIPAVVLGGLVAAGLGFSLPRIILGAMAAERGRRLIRGLPLAMDVIGLCLTAGQNLLGSMQQTSRELDRPCPDLAEELRIVHEHAQMHSLEAALLQWSDRIELPEVRALALLLVQSDRLGTDMVNTLLEVADSQRIHLRQKAEAQANRSNFWMLLPTLFCLWTASAIVLVGPVYLEFWKYRREQMNILVGGVRGTVEQSNLNAAKPAAEGEQPPATTPPRQAQPRLAPPGKQS